MADDDEGALVTPEEAFQPQRRLQVEIVARLVKQQQVRLGKERARERDTCPPAAREGGTGALLRVMIKTETREDLRGPRLRRVGVDIGKAGVDLGNAHAIGRRLRLLHQACALDIGGEHRLDQAFRSAGRFLRQDAKPRAVAQLDRAAIGMNLPGDHLEQR